MRTAVLVALLGMILPAGLLAEAEHGHAPYAGWEGRAIKALSPEQVDDLQSGRGMGLALAAELNGYPGPLHVLELADQLDLTASQRAETQRLFDAMQADAVALGEQVIAAEAALDRLFATGTASDAAITAAAVEVGRAQGVLRAHHLRYHVAMRELLSPHQVARYGQLRGYAAEAAHGPRAHGDGEAHDEHR
jgi:Spy/CpxP family protein refolding chaperone